MIFYMDLGTGWEDITDYVRDDFSSVNRASSDDYKHAVNTLNFTLIYNQSLFTRLHVTLGYVYFRVMEDDDTTYLFNGRFKPSVELDYNGVADIQMISVTADDFTSMLDVSMTEFVTEDMYIMNPADATHSIVHVLFTHLGLSHSLIDPGMSILDTVGAAVADDDSNALDFISTILFEYGWVANWNEAGLFHPIRWIQVNGSAPTFTFDQNNIQGSIQESSNIIDMEATKVIWYGLGERTAIRVYTEGLDYDEDGDFEGYPILRETFYPDEANVVDETTGTYQVVRQEYAEVGIRYDVSKYIKAGYAQDFALEHADFTRILVTKNHTIGDRFDVGLSRDITSFGNKSAQIRYWNPQITSRQLYYMHIDADITYTKSKCTSLVEYVANTKRINTYDTSYLFTAADADKLAQAMASADRHGRYFYTIKSEEFVAEGTYVSIVPGNGLNATGLVLERAYDNVTRLYTYKVRSYNTSYLAVAARTVRRSSLAVTDGMTIATSADKSPSFTIEGDKQFNYHVGVTPPINTSVTVSGVCSNEDYDITSLQWYYRDPGGVDTILAGQTNAALTIAYNAAWYYSGVTVILLVNGKYAFTAEIRNSYQTYYLGEFTTDPLYPGTGDWYFYKGTTGGGRTQYTMYYWTGLAWAADTNPDHIPMLYTMDPNSDTLNIFSNGTYFPTTLTISATRKVGLAPYFPYAGRFTVEVSSGGTTFTNVYTSSANESSCTYTPTGTASMIRFRLYLAGGTSTVLSEWLLNVSADALTIQALSSVPIDDAAFYSCDNVPEIPDNAAGIQYVQDEWLTTDGWNANTAGPLTVSGGKLRASTLQNGAYKTTGLTDPQGKIITLKVVSVTGGIHRIGYRIGTTWYNLITPVLVAGVDTILTAVFPSGSVINGLLLGGQPNIDYAWDWIYIGTGAYDTVLLDNSGNLRNLSMVGVSPIIAKNNKGIYFNGGAYCYGDITKFTRTGAFTMSFWIQGAASRAANQYLFARDSGAAPNRGFGLMMTLGNRPYFYVTGDGTNLIAVGDVAGTECTADCVITYKFVPSVGIYIYKNGNLIASNTTSIPALAFYSATQKVSLGALAYTGSVYIGWIDEIHYILRALTDAEILSLYLYPGAKGENYTWAQWLLDPTNPLGTVANRTPSYLGALTADPSVPNFGDWYFYIGTTGGGRTQYTMYVYTVAGWVADSDPAHLAAAFTDLIDVAGAAPDVLTIVQNLVANTALVNTLIADTAFINSLSASQAFIVGLFANEITVPDGGRFRLYNGQGGQQRCLQIEKDNIDYIDAPDTSPASPEVLRGRIGRLGVGSTILLDGDFGTNIVAPWNGLSAIDAASTCSMPKIVELSTGRKLVVYKNNATNRVMFSYSDNNGSTWSAPASMTGGVAGIIVYGVFETPAKEVIVITYDGGTHIVAIESANYGATWPASYNLISVTAGTMGGGSVFTDKDGSVHFIYRRILSASDHSIVVRKSTPDGITWGNAIVIFQGDASNQYEFSAIEETISGDLVALGSRYIGPASYRLDRSVSSDDGATWSAPVQISTNTTWNFDLIRKITKEMLMIYSDTSNCYYTSSMDDGATWSAPVTIPGPGANSIPSAAGAVNGDTLLAFVDSSNDLYFERKMWYASLGAGIIEQGSNANGEYVLFSDGSILQFGTRSMTTSLTTSNIFGSSSGTTYYKDETQTLPYVMPNITYKAWANSSGLGTRVNGGTDKTTTTIRILVFYNSSATIAVDWFVWGRWK